MVVAAGVTLSEALLAHRSLGTVNIGITVIDLFSVKPLDRETILQSARQTTTKIVLTVEDHYLQGGIFGMIFVP